MRPWVKYTLGRLGLLVGALLILLVLFPGMDLILTLLIAFVVSFALSWFLLRGWRDEMANDLARTAERRKQKKQQLRSALAGEDEPAPGDSRDARGEPENPSR